MTDAEPRKPRFALFVATAAGLGYLPKAPGTWGSLGGILFAMIPGIALDVALFRYGGFVVRDLRVGGLEVDPDLFFQCALAFLIASVGVWAAGRAGKYLREKDPQRVVVDEVSGQHVALILGAALPLFGNRASIAPSDYSFGLSAAHIALNWKYLLLGFILFRAFDIWKPFPARQAESLPGGWGIMADDWVAGIYAALGLWIARMLGL